MLGDVYVRAAMDQFRRMTIALVGIGALQPSIMLTNSGNAFTKEELQDSENKAQSAISPPILRSQRYAGSWAA